MRLALLLEAFCKLISPNDSYVDCGYPNTEEMLKKALMELRETEDLFARVEDNAMIDYAIYSMKAAEERCNYLIGIIKNNDDRRRGTIV